MGVDSLDFLIAGIASTIPIKLYLIHQLRKSNQIRIGLNETISDPNEGIVGTLRGCAYTLIDYIKDSGLKKIYFQRYK